MLGFECVSFKFYCTCSGGAFSMKIGDGASDFEPSDDPIAAGAIGEEDGSKYDVPDPVS